MTRKFHLSSIALLIGSIALTGCASKQVWSPELEQAREVVRQAADDPLVNTLASAELAIAKKQLQAAEDASDYYKDRAVIAHEATLAKLKALEAQQTAKALAVKQDIKVARLNAAPAPALAAANPETAVPKALVNQPSNTAVPQTQVETQLAALADQLAQLQLQLQGVSAGTTYSESEIDHSDSVASTVTFSETTDQLLTPELASALPGDIKDRDVTLASLDQTPTTNVLSTARLREELRAMNARPSGRGMSLTLGERYFESGTARLWNGRIARHLDNVAAVMVEHPGLVLEIDAHSDNVGATDSNDNLTANRAIAVKSALVIRGIDAARINATGYGDSAPVADNNTQLGRLQNRRVELVFPNITGG